MGKYCDPKILESTWLSWIISDKIPDLEPIRHDMGLWSKIIDETTIKHCVATTDSFNFDSTSGIVHSDDLDCAFKSSFLPLDLNLVRDLIADNFLLELPSSESWDMLSNMVYSICEGVSLNFHPPNEEVKNELIHNAFVQTLSKIRSGKLEFTPGKAPAFNLLTTAIFRIMYSIKNKEKRDKEKRIDLADKLINNSNSLPRFNSIEVSRSLIKNECNIKTC